MSKRRNYNPTKEKNKNRQNLTNGAACKSSGYKPIADNTHTRSQTVRKNNSAVNNAGKVSADETVCNTVHEESVPRPATETLLKDWGTLTYREMAAKYGVAKTTISNWVKDAKRENENWREYAVKGASRIPVNISGSENETPKKEETTTPQPVADTPAEPDTHVDARVFTSTDIYANDVVFLAKTDAVVGGHADGRKKKNTGEKQKNKAPQQKQSVKKETPAKTGKKPAKNTKKPKQKVKIKYRYGASPILVVLLCTLSCTFGFLMFEYIRQHNESPYINPSMIESYTETDTGLILTGKDGKIYEIQAENTEITDRIIP